MDAIGDTIERLVKAVGKFAVIVDHRSYGPGGRVGTRRGAMLGVAGMSTATASIENVCPGWNTSCTETGSWGDDTVSTWFARYASEHGITAPTAKSQRRPATDWFGRPKRRRGAPVYRPGATVKARRIDAAHFDVWIPPADSPVQRPEPGYIYEGGQHELPGQITISVLWQMACWLGFTATNRTIYNERL